MEYVIMFWILCAIAGGAMLSRYNKAGTWFFLGGVLGPIGPIIALNPRDDAKIKEVAATTGQRSSLEVRDERECPYCAERILRKARVCKHCNREVQPMA